MNTQIIIFDKPEGKKHSVRYDTTEDNPAIGTIYVRREYLGTKAPKKLKITIEEVEE
jgi:hypothetical protein